MIGTTIVVSISCSSMTAYELRVEQRDRHRGSPARGNTEDAGDESCMEHRRLEEKAPFLAKSYRGEYMVHVEDLGALLEQDALGEAGGPSRVHQNGGIVLIRLGRHDRAADRHQVFVSQNASIRLSVDHDHSVDHRTLVSGPLEESGKRRVSEDDFGTRSLRTYASSEGENDVQRIDDAAPNIAEWYNSMY